MRATILLAATFALTLTTALPAQAGHRRWNPLLRLAERHARAEFSRSTTYTYAPGSRAAYEVMTAPPAVEASAYAAPNATVGGGDPYGFLPILNRYRASVGLPAVALDPNLSSWASRNNAAQSRRGLGHHINPNCFQNCGWNYTSARGVFLGWLNSPGHRQNMLSPAIRRVGIAYGPGPYWTMNAR